MKDISNNIELNSDFLRARDNNKVAFSHNGDIYCIPNMFLNDGEVRNTSKRFLQGKDNANFYYIIRYENKFVSVTADEYIEISHKNYLEDLEMCRNGGSIDSLINNLKRVYLYALKYRKASGRVYNHRLITHNPFFDFDVDIKTNEKMIEIAERVSETVRNFFISSNNLDLNGNTNGENSCETVILDKTRLLDMLNNTAEFLVFKDEVAQKKTLFVCQDDNFFNRLIFEKEMVGRPITNSKLPGGRYVNMGEMYKRLLKYGGKDLVVIKPDNSTLDINAFMSSFYIECLKDNLLFDFGEKSKEKCFEEIIDSYTGEKIKFEDVKVTKGVYVNKTKLQEAFEKNTFLGLKKQVKQKINK